jgi:hypothetical protein
VNEAADAISTLARSIKSLCPGKPLQCKRGTGDPVLQKPPSDLSVAFFVKSRKIKCFCMHKY